MAAIGYPLAGDWLYGQESPELIARPRAAFGGTAVTHRLQKNESNFARSRPDDMQKLCGYGNEPNETGGCRI
jgi:hypothetical protein